MKSNKRILFTIICVVLLLSIPSVAQHPHPSQKKATSNMDMASMMQSPHHKLMMAYLTSMSAFATALHEQSMKAEGLDIEAARSAVSELRHNLDAMDALHEKHMQSMSSDMQAKMQSMKQKMEEHRTTLKNQVSALESDVQADKPNMIELRNHASALVKHLQMISTMHGGTKKGAMKM